MQNHYIANIDGDMYNFLYALKNAYWDIMTTEIVPYKLMSIITNLTQVSIWEKILGTDHIQYYFDKHLTSNWKNKSPIENAVSSYTNSIFTDLDEKLRITLHINHTGLTAQGKYFPGFMQTLIGQDSKTIPAISSRNEPFFQKYNIRTDDKIRQDAVQKQHTDTTVIMLENEILKDEIFSILKDKTLYEKTYDKMIAILDNSADIIAAAYARDHAFDLFFKNNKTINGFDQPYEKIKEEFKTLCEKPDSEVAHSIDTTAKKLRQYAINYHDPDVKEYLMEPNSPLCRNSIEKMNIEELISQPWLYDSSTVSP